MVTILTLIVLFAALTIRLLIRFGHSVTSTIALFLFFACGASTRSKFSHLFEFAESLALDLRTQLLNRSVPGSLTFAWRFSNKRYYLAN